MFPFINLLVEISGNSRQRVARGIDFEWSYLWVFNIFRIYELIFGRRYGVRREVSSTGWEENGVWKQKQIYWSLEAKCAHLEIVFRSFLKWKLPFRITVPLLKTPSGVLIPASPYLFAIARDTSVSIAVGASPRTLAQTCTGSNLLMVLGTLQSIAGVDHVTGVTYNSAALTAIGVLLGTANGNTYTIDTWYLNNPSTGNNNIVASTLSDLTTVAIMSTSYSGTASGAPENSGTTPNTSANNLTNTTTSISSDNCWAWMVMSDGGSNPSAGSGSNQLISGIPGGAGSYDTNGVITPAAAANSMTVSWTGGPIDGNSYKIVFAPTGAAVITRGRLLSLLGVG